MHCHRHCQKIGKQAGAELGLSCAKPRISWSWLGSGLAL